MNACLFENIKNKRPAGCDGITKNSVGDKTNNSNLKLNSFLQFFL